MTRWSRVGSKCTQSQIYYLFENLGNLRYFNNPSSFFQDAEDLFIILEPLMGGDLRLVHLKDSVWFSDHYQIKHLSNFFSLLLLKNCIEISKHIKFSYVGTLKKKLSITYIFSSFHLLSRKLLRRQISIEARYYFFTFQAVLLDPKFCEELIISDNVFFVSKFWIWQNCLKSKQRNFGFNRDRARVAPSLAGHANDIIE